MTNRIIIDKLEFYITNVCNLTCSECNRYNNYKFSGWQNYDDYAKIIQQWSEKIDIIKPSILGGEPLLNPSINKWVVGIRDAWPDRFRPEIVTNGTRIDIVDGLYDLCLQKKTWLGVSIHRDDDKETIFNRIRNFLSHPIKEGIDIYPAVKCDYQFIDVNNVFVYVWLTTNFLQSNIITRLDGTQTLYNSEPIAAHSACSFAIHKNYHFINGKIYKCGPVALMPEFDSQYPFDIGDEDRALLHSGRGLSIDEFDEYGETFFANIDNPIPQCKFCPESQSWKKIEFTDLKFNKI